MYLLTGKLGFPFTLNFLDMYAIATTTENKTIISANTGGSMIGRIETKTEKGLFGFRKIETRIFFVDEVYTSKGEKVTEINPLSVYTRSGRIDRKVFDRFADGVKNVCKREGLKLVF